MYPRGIIQELDGVKSSPEDLAKLEKQRAGFKKKGLSSAQQDKAKHMNKIMGVDAGQKVKNNKRYITDNKPFNAYSEAGPPGSERAKRMPKTRHPNDWKALDEIYFEGGVRGKAVDHGIPLQNKTFASGLDVPDNMTLMDPKLNSSKLDRLPDDFGDFEWRHNEKTGRLDGYRRTSGKPYSKGMEGLTRVPRSQGGFIDPKLLKNIGKVGLIGAGEMALNYAAPDNPLAQARNRGDDLTGQVFGTNLSEGIAGIENPYLRASAHLGSGLLVDPLLTAAGAGANMGDRLYNEIQGTNQKANFKRGQGLGGRLQPNRGLIDG
jgi:hypothetical protein